MNNVATTTRAKLETAAAATYFLPALLAVNTFALLALDRMGSIPSWVKAAGALFLSF